MRTVTSASVPDSPKLRGRGLFLRLTCSHQMWFATPAQPSHMMGAPFPCLGGCYQPRRNMGEGPL